MKKLTLTLFVALVFVFSIVPVSAEEGGVPIMGVTCGITGKPACPPPPGLAAPSNEDTSIIKTVFDYLTQLFD